mgnify:CR=1 FL=1
MNNFFNWVSEKGYSDGALIHQYISNIFNYHAGFGILIEEKKYVDILKPLLSETKLIANDIYSSHSNISFDEDSIYIRLDQEPDYEDAFYVLEILINKGLYAK